MVGVRTLRPRDFMFYWIFCRTFDGVDFCVLFGVLVEEMKMVERWKRADRRTDRRRFKTALLEAINQKKHLIGNYRTPPVPRSLVIGLWSMVVGLWKIGKNYLVTFHECLFKKGGSREKGVIAHGGCEKGVIARRGADRLHEYTTDEDDEGDRYILQGG